MRFAGGAGFFRLEVELNEPELPIVDLLPDNASAVEHCATLLYEVFMEHHPATWPDMASARTEVEEFFAEGRISRIAVDGDGTVIGWVGAIRAYDGFAWELHPLVVRPEQQRRGLGRRLVTDIEARVREQGGVTIWLGTDDEDNQTSLGGIELYDDVLGHLARIRNLNDHPYEFYRKVGFTIVGVLPDANGFGKPDIFMAKRIRPA